MGLSAQTIYTQAQLRLHYFPILASVSWFSTLTILLLRWLSLGRPRYPGQVNPTIPFISDIAAFQFKPVFIIGCTLTALGFVGTVFCVHHVRYSARFYGIVDDTKWRKATSGVALLTGLFAGTCLLLLSIFDTFEDHAKHRFLLVCVFGGLALSAITTQVVWWDETWATFRFPGLRKWCLVNNILVLCITGVGTAFLVFVFTDYYGRAGVLEWTITYLGALWLATFSGYIRFREDTSLAMAVEDPETQPLLPASGP